MISDFPPKVILFQNCQSWKHTRFRKDPTIWWFQKMYFKYNNIGRLKVKRSLKRHTTKYSVDQRWRLRIAKEIRIYSEDSSGNPVVKTLCSTAGGVGSVPGKELRSFMLCCVGGKKTERENIFWTDWKLKKYKKIFEMLFK